jgi:hypothetical protein
MSQDRLVSRMTGYEMDGQQRQGFFCHYVHTSSGTQPISYPVGTWDSLPPGKSSHNVKISTHHHLVPKLKMHEAMHPCPHMPS